jgi:2-dehydropantoate 2-reductase
MEIIVLGAGAIGSLFGAKLAATNDVTLVGRAEHVAAINSRGLRLEGLESRGVSVRAVTAVEKINPRALVILATKVSDSTAALVPIAPLVQHDTTILCLQNGLNSETIAREALGHRGIILRGITQAGAIFKAPGLIEFMARGHTVIEPHERSAAIARAFSEAGLDCRISTDITADVWHKLVINCVVNPITAILGCDVGGIANPQLDPLKRLVIDECGAVAASQGVTLVENLQQELDDFFRPSHNFASMLQDLRRGHATEIDYMNGAVAALAASKNIPCPVNAALTAIVKAMEKSPRPPESN